MAPDHKIDESILKNIILEPKIEYKNEIKNYEFDNKDDFEKYESMTIWGKIKQNGPVLTNCY